MKNRVSLTAAVFAFALIAPFAAAAETACSDLATWTRADARVDAAEVQAATGSLPEHCKVSGTISTEIHFQLLLPSPSAWNGRFVMGGGGGFSGAIQNSAMEAMPGGNALQRGFATSGTDTGHKGSVIDGSWALDNDEREIDFAHRSVHRTTEVSKELIAAYYGREAERSYFLGCSRGGGQAMIEAQRYPDDYDGIVAMAPAYSWARLGTAFVQNQQKNLPDPTDFSQPVVDNAARSLIASAVAERCDDDDGVVDGVLGDPRTCDFSPAELRCSGEAADSCLTDQQIEALERIYGGPVVDGVTVFPGFPYGAEDQRGGWDTWTTGVERDRSTPLPNLHYAFGTQLFKYLVYDDPDFDYSNYDFANWAEDIAHMDELLSASDPDLSAMRDSGGKLLLWHGWADPALTPLATIDYYDAVLAVDPNARDYTRLFMAPGVLHCAGGAGPDAVDFLSAISDWAERGVAPDRLLALKLSGSGETELSRPLCPYPQVAVWDGSGPTTDASSFACKD